MNMVKKMSFVKNNKNIIRGYTNNTQNLSCKEEPYNNGPKFPMGKNNFIIFLIGFYIYNREYK